eukprot:6179635-Amphidinium_carterae.1
MTLRAHLLLTCHDNASATIFTLRIFKQGIFPQALNARSAQATRAEEILLSAYTPVERSNIQVDTTA